MRPILSIVCAASAAVLLASCGSEPDDAAQRQSAAEGEILPRSVSDEMLPYDTVRSQPPLAEPTGDNERVEGQPDAEVDIASE